AWWFAVDVTLLLFVLVGALVVFGQAARRTEFDGDEGAHIQSARYFGYLFSDHDFRGRVWGDTYATHNRPMLSSYVLGGWLAARGYQLEKLPVLADWGRLERGSAAERSYYGQLLATAREPMVALATGTAVMVFLLGRLAGGPIAGLVAAGLTAGS